MAKRKAATKKKAPAKRKAAAKKKPAPVDPAAVDAAIALLLTLCSQTEVRAQLAGKFPLSAESVGAAIDEAQRRLALAAGVDRTAELARSVARLNHLFQDAADPKVGLAVVRELNKLLRLYDAPGSEPGADLDAADRATLEAEIRAARAQLLPLALAPEDTALSELCRLAVGRIVELSRNQ